MADAPITTSFPPSPVNPNLNKTAGKEQTGNSAGKNQPQKNKTLNQTSDFERELASASRKSENPSKPATKPKPPIEKTSKNSANDGRTQRNSNISRKVHSNPHKDPKTSLKDASSQPTKAASNTTTEATTEPAAKISTTQPANSTANETRRENPTQQSLQPLKKAAANNKSAVDESPVVALLTGHLDRLNPESIPELVSTNSFVTSAISYDEITAYLNKPTPVRELLENLNVPQQIIDEAEEMGFDTSVIISPNDILRALGLDPQRVFVELKQLKDNLPLDGFKSYMQRAAMMQKGNASDSSTQPDALSRAKLQRDADAAKALSQGLPINSAQNFSVKDTLDGKQNSQARPQLSASEPQYFFENSYSTEQILASPLLTLSQQPTTDNLRGGTIEDTGTRIADTFVNQKINQDQIFEGQASSQSAPELSMPMQSQQELNQTLKQSESGTASLPQFKQGTGTTRLKSTNSDAFTTLGQKLDPEQTIKLQDPNKVPANIQTASQFNASNTSVNIDRLLVEMSTLDQANGLEPNNNSEIRKIDLIPDDSGISSQNSTDLRLLAINQAELDDRSRIESPILKDIWKTMLPEYESLTSSNLPSENLSDALNEVTEFSNQTMEKLDSSNYDSAKNDQQGFSEQKPGEFGISTDNTSQQTTNSTRDYSPRFEIELAKLNDSKPIMDYSEITQKILDRASILSKDGGGVINIDLSSPEMGRLELAMNFQNDRIDLRIMAENERARDAISSGIGQIRDALSMQNIQLGSAEVGVGKRDTNQNNQFFGAFEQQQSQRQFGDNDSRRERARNWQSDLENQTRILTQPIAQQSGLTRNYIKSPDSSDIDGLISVRA